MVDSVSVVQNATNTCISLFQVFLGVLFHNENTNEDIEAVLEAVQKYVPNIDNDNMKEYPISQGLEGDQLSVERGANQLLQVANVLTPPRSTPRNC
jgi:hypothetical protein